jgi:hypothetical protein
VGKKIEEKDEVEVCVTKLGEGKPMAFSKEMADDFSDHESDKNSGVE